MALMDGSWPGAEVPPRPLCPLRAARFSAFLGSGLVHSLGPPAPAHPLCRPLTAAASPVEWPPAIISSAICCHGPTPEASQPRLLSVPSVSRYAVSNTIRDVTSDIPLPDGDTEEHSTHIDTPENMVLGRARAGRPTPGLGARVQRRRPSLVGAASTRRGRP